MRRLALPLLIVVFAAVGGAAGFLLGGHVYDNPPAPPGVDQVATGAQVPALEWRDADGTARPLSDWRGRLLVVNYWASWCPPCIEEMPMLDRWAADNASSGVSVVGVAEDDPEAVRAFLERHPVAYPILFAGAGQAGSSMQLGNSRGVLPFTAVIGPDGVLLERRAGLLDRARLDDWLARYGDTP